MPSRDIVVIGASAGGIEALSKLVSYLPADLQATLFVVVHIPPLKNSYIPDILARKGNLPVAHAENGELFEKGKIYVAPPGLHMVIDGERVALNAKARENGHRPAVDPLFRSAARFHGPRVVGVILSGTLDDGTAGANAISLCGGYTIAQDPEEASFAGMIKSVMRYDHVQKVLPIAEIAEEIVRLAATPLTQEELALSDEARRQCDREKEILTVVDQRESHTENEPGAVPSVYVCPECNGTLFETKEGNLHFRCRVGHAYSPDTLLSQQAGTVEAALWSAVRALEESAALSRRLADRAQEEGRPRSAKQFGEHERESRQQSTLIRNLLMGERLQTVPGDDSPGEKDEAA